MARPGVPSTAVNPKDAWFRSPDWDAQAQSEFTARLARARSRSRSRVQYEYIKGLALLGSRDPEKEDAGRGLLEGILSDPDAYRHDRVSVICFLGANAQDAGHLDEAERYL